MANIRPTLEERPASVSLDQSIESRSLESFLWKLLMLSALAYFVWSEKISIDIGFVAIRKAELSDQFERHSADFFGLLGIASKSGTGVRLEEDALNNLTFAIDPTYARRYHTDDETIRQSHEKCRLFIKRFSPVAIAEMRRYGVPASILLAQSLLASDAGTDVQALESNNFFLRTCQDDNCKALHFTRAGGEEGSDVFSNLWGSFRAQSLFFKNSETYNRLMDGRNADYSTWARALDVFGYAADPQYGAKILALVKSLDLESFDRR